VATSGSKHRVLIVDDETLNIRFLENLLSSEIDIGVIFTTSGEDALDIARSTNKPDLILLDIVMPGLDGYEVCRRLKADPETASIPVIFITTKGGPEEEARGLDLGAVDYILKPFDPDAVQKKVRNHLAQLRRMTSALSQASREDGPRRGGGPSLGLYPTLAIGLLIAVAVLVVGYAVVELDIARPGTLLDTAPPQERVGSSSPSPNSPDKSSLPTRTFPASALSWVADSRCGDIPDVAWWRVKSHQAVAKYVGGILKGDWSGYLAKWRERLENVRDIQSRNSTAITNTGVHLSGADLDAYVGQMTQRVTVIECLAKEAALAASARN